MKIWVTSLAQAPQVARRIRPSRAVSLLSPDDRFPEFPELSDGRHHRVHVDDIREAVEGRVAPTSRHVAGVVEFLKAHDPEEALLVHCWAGMSRSTATAFIAACLYNPQTDEREIAHELRWASPTAYPSTRIVAFADEMLGRDGRMAAAARSICDEEGRLARCAAAVEAEPFSLPALFNPTSTAR